MLILVVSLFAILWLPVHAHLLVFYFVGSTDHVAYKVASIFWYCCAYFNSCVNPIIYNRTSEEFRNAFRAAIHCRGIEHLNGGEDYEVTSTQAKHKRKKTVNNARACEEFSVLRKDEDMRDIQRLTTPELIAKNETQGCSRRVLFVEAHNATEESVLGGGSNTPTADPDELGVSDKDVTVECSCVVKAATERCVAGHSSEN